MNNSDTSIANYEELLYLIKNLHQKTTVSIYPENDFAEKYFFNKLEKEKDITILNDFTDIIKIEREDKLNNILYNNTKKSIYYYRDNIFGRDKYGNSTRDLIHKFDELNNIVIFKSITDFKVYNDDIFFVKINMNKIFTYEI